MKRTKRFDDGGDIVADRKDAADLERQIDERRDIGELAPESSSITVRPKSKIVSKEELAKSGLSLNAYMNQQQGLTPRDKPKVVPAPSVPPVASVASVPSAVRSTDISQIPLDKAPAGMRGDRIDSTELGRNFRTGLSALTPMGGGVLKVANELAFAKKGQQAYNNTAALRRAEEGLNPAEATVAALKASGRESVTNPLSWMAGPKNAKNFRPKKNALSEADTTGGAIGAKRGGMIKKMASGGMTSSASKRGDGIAQKGKTRGRMC